MKVKQIMTSSGLKACTPDTRLHNAVKTMKTGNCGALPVIDKSRRVVGLVTDRDIALSLSRKETSSSRTSVGDIIPKKVFTVHEEADLGDALKVMRTRQVGRLPVVDTDGRLRGVLSMHNLLSQSLDGKTGLGTLSEDGESILRTVKALNDRYNGRKLSASRKKVKA